MELLDISFWQPWMLVALFIFLAAVVVALVYRGMDNHKTLRETAISIAVVTPIFTLVGGVLMINSAQANLEREFERTYMVNVESEDYVLPAYPNLTKSILMYTNRGLESCLVQTDNTKYTVTCSGRDMPVINEVN